MRSPILKLENVSRLLGDRWCLHDISLDIMPGEVIAVVGANGAGKTTLLRLLSGSLAPTRGQVMLGGVDLYRQRDRVQTRIGLVPEQPALYEDLSVQAYLDFMGTLQGLPQARLAARIAAAKAAATLQIAFSALDFLRGPKTLKRGASLGINVAGALPALWG